MLIKSIEERRLYSIIKARFFFLKRDDANVIISVVLTLILKNVPRYVDADPFDIQVLTPMRKGLLSKR